MSTASGIIRVGREPTPSERGLRNALEKPELLEHLSKNFYQSELGLSPRIAVAEWTLLSEAEREAWRERTVAYLRSFVADRGVTDVEPDDPNPGSFWPVIDEDVVFQVA
ncbi:MAG TPA: hypothetical protein VK399_13210 [Longimicrobiaceae bacterium]|nr:hypothetical protein [Longimicrobiaceae bacterium]